MTRRGLLVAVGAVVAWLVGRLIGVDELSVVAVAALAVVAGAWIAVVWAGAGVAVRRDVSHHRLAAGTPARVVLELRNAGRLPVPLVLGGDAAPRALLARDTDARFVVPRLGRGERVRADYGVRGDQRGRFTLGPLTLRVRDPFGLAERRRRYRASDTVVVYPAIEELPGGLSLGRHHGSGSSHARRLFNTGSEFHTMREYVDGDDLRHVHWPSTARRERLMVRQNEQPWDTQALVLLDTRLGTHHGAGPEGSLERTVSAGASILWHLDAAGYRMRLVTEADVRPPGVASLGTCLDRLAVLEGTEDVGLSGVLTRLRSAEAEGLLVAVLPAAPGDDAEAELRALLQVGRAFSGRIAVLVDTGAPGSGERAAQLSAMLSAAGWRTGVLSPSGGLGAAWQEVIAGGRATTSAAAYRPGDPRPEAGARR